MTTGNKSALNAVRYGLLAGLSATALMLAMSSAQAQALVNATGGTASVPVTLDGSGNLTATTPITGLGFTGGAGITFAGAGGGITGDGTNSTLTNFLSVSGTTITDGVASLTGGSLTVVTNVTGTGLGALSGFATIDGTTINAGVGGLTSGGTLGVTGLSTFGATGNTTIDANGNVAVGGTLDVTGNSTFTGTTTTTGLATFNGGATVNGTTTLAGVTNFGTSGDTSISAAGNYTTTAGSITTTNGNITATNGTITGATVHATSSLAVSNGATVDMGNNVVHGVATPIVGTDAANKAYVDRGVNKAFEGTAIALAISQPMFQPGQSFAMRAGWGEFENTNAFGVSAAGVIARDVLGYGSTIVVDAGVGAGSNYNTVAGKAGVTFGFGGGTAPLK